MSEVTSVVPRTAYRIDLVFSDGLSGCVDIASLVPFDGVFAPLRDEAYFRSVTVNTELGTIVQPNGAGLCPDVLYEAVRRDRKLPV